MVRNKSPNNISIEQLLEKAADKESPTDYKPPKEKSITSFILHFNLKPGKELVSIQLLYDLYNLWSPNPAKIYKFGKVIRKYLISYTHKKQTFVKLDVSSAKITEETLKILEKQTKETTKVKVYRNNFDKFISSFNIKNGNFFIEGYILFDLYDEWCYNNKYKSLSYITFLKFCRLYFKYKRVRNVGSLFYGINEEVKQVLTEERIARLRLYKKNREKKKKDNQKKQI